MADCMFSIEARMISRALPLVTIQSHSDFTAAVVWGDGSSGVGTVVANLGGEDLPACRIDRDAIGRAEE